MKVKLITQVAMVGVFSILSCTEDEVTKRPPQVITVETVTEITTTTATVSGEIINDGSAKITESGFVYSNFLESPTIADQKVLVTAIDGTLITTLQNLTSGSNYYVRAYAKNSVDISYGDAVHFSTDNGAPIATDVSITGEAALNSTLTVSYTYRDAENDPEGPSVLQWYVDDDGAEGGEVPIAGANTLTFKIPNEAAWQGKYILVGVIPKATQGTLDGTELKSAHTPGIGEAISVTFMYNKQEVTYGIIVSPVTGRKWLDRNLGAANTPTAYYDELNDDNYKNYGDLFQWGRGNDGHQLVTRYGHQSFNGDGVWVGTEISGNAVRPGDPGYISGTVPTDEPGHSKFILASWAWDDNDPYDWRKPQNDNLWQGVNGINNPCPLGWRIPTRPEFEAENLTSGPQAYTLLRLNATGRRNSDSGIITGNESGQYWTSTTVTLPYSPGVHGNGASRLALSSTLATFDSPNQFVAVRTNGYACRCIKDQ